MNIRLSRNHVALWSVAAIAFASFAAHSANAQQRRHYGTPPEQNQDEPNVRHPEQVYDDEPPLDFHQRRWRAYSRNWRPQRFHLRDANTRFGHNPPFYGGYGGFYDPYHYGFGGADAYLQGRHDERQFQDWKASNDIGYAAYMSAMEDGLQEFANADYPAAAAAFLRAAKQNQGDPASRLHATYALVAIRNYDDAVLILRRAMQLQSRLVDLPLNIPAEYTRRQDFDAHYKDLSETADANPDHAGVWMLLGFYQLFSDQGAAAAKSIERSAELAPEDSLIQLLHERARYAAIASPKPADKAKPLSEPRP